MIMVFEIANLELKLNTHSISFIATTRVAKTLSQGLHDIVPTPNEAIPLWLRQPRQKQSKAPKISAKNARQPNFAINVRAVVFVRAPWLVAKRTRIDSRATVDVIERTFYDFRK